jgi:hypothetical protein
MIRSLLSGGIFFRGNYGAGNQQAETCQKVVILGSIKSDKEKSRLIKAGQITKIPKVLPVTFFNERTTNMYSVVRKFFDPKNPKVLQYFRVKDRII